MEITSKANNVRQSPKKLRKVANCVRGLNVNKALSSLKHMNEKGAEIVELKQCEIKKDPVRPELDNEFRTSYGRKIYGVKYKNEIHAVMCFAFTNKIPKTVHELDVFSRDAFLQSVNRDQNVGKIAIAYTVWSNKKGGGKLIVKEVFEMIKKTNHLNRLVTLSPLTDMARNFHLNNGAEEVQVNEHTQNFEYKL